MTRTLAKLEISFTGATEMAAPVPHGGASGGHAAAASPERSDALNGHAAVASPVGSDTPTGSWRPIPVDVDDGGDLSDRGSPRGSPLRRETSLRSRSIATQRVALLVGVLCGGCICFALSAITLVGLIALKPLPDVLPGGLAPLYEVATGFAWAENLVCARRNDTLHGSTAASLFVTDNHRGDLMRIDWRQHGAVGHYSLPKRHPASNDFELMAGITVNARTGQLFVLGNRRRGHGDSGCVLIDVDAFANRSLPAAETYTVAARLDRWCIGDGLALHEATGLLYAANQGSFVPRNGVVYEIDVQRGKAAPLLTGAFGTDGIFVDQARGLLYVSETLSISHSILVYDLIAREMVGRIHPRGVSTLDDFTLSADGHTILAADFLGNSGVSFDTGVTRRRRWRRHLPENVFALVSGVTEPTSIRRGCSDDRKSGFHEELFFISEGGGLSDKSTDRRVLAFAMRDAQGLDAGADRSSR